MTDNAELVSWWWNGRWGRLARRDLKVYRASETTRDVEAIDGGAEGRYRRWHHVPIDEAVELCQDLMSDSDGWQRMQGNHE